MSRPLTISQLLKRTGLAKRSRADRPTPPVSKQLSLKRARSTAVADGTEVHRRRSREGDNGGDDGAQGEEGATGGGNLDDQIVALERELQRGDESISDESSSTTTGEDSEEDTSVDGGSREGGRQQTKLVSPLEAEKIEPLPAYLLPRPGCGMQKAYKKSKKRAKGDATPGAPPIASGLDSAVKELLANYEARSSERVPFYCRVCQFQGDSLEALQRHKEEPLHLVATKKERKISSCSLCKKQFTSPPQLKEHLAGKAHQERLQAVLSRQGKWIPGARAGRGRGAGRGGGGERTRGDRRGGDGPADFSNGGNGRGYSSREEGGVPHGGGDWAAGRGRGRGARNWGGGARDGGRGRGGRMLQG